LASEERAYRESLIRTADASLETAKEMLGIGKFDAAVFYAALAGENAGNALIITVGGRPSKRHRVDAALSACFSVRKEKIPAEIEQAIEKLKWLEPHVTISRYPVKIGGKWVAPPERYRESDAGKAIVYAEAVVRVAKSMMSPSQKVKNRGHK
jgi:HEPN domain-containing protein